MSSYGPDAFTAAVAAYLDSQTALRVPVDGLREHLYAAHPFLHGHLQARRRLLDALGSLVISGQIALPPSRSATGWDTTMAPALPLWVIRKNRPPEPDRGSRRRTVYPGRLECAAAIATRDDEIDLINRVADWLRDRPEPMFVPMEERSLELFGNEKTLGEKMATRLFTSGALSLNLLRCHVTPTPLPSQYIPGEGRTVLLVCENRAAYYSAVTAARALPAGGRPDLHVAYGVGDQFSASHTEIAFLDPVPLRGRYCGDLDQAGIEIAARAASMTAGLLKLEPAVAFYDWMLAHGTPQPDPSNRRNTDYESLLDWFPEALRPRILDLLHHGTKISQETVGLEVLTRHSEMIRCL